MDRECSRCDGEGRVGKGINGSLGSEMCELCMGRGEVPSYIQ